jgi:hypothetical protein
MNDALKSAGEPVRQSSASLAVSQISRMRTRMRTRRESDWSAMRLGIKRDYVYVAPVERGARGSRRGRPNIKTKLLDEAMAPALVQNSSRVAQEFHDAVKDMGRFWARV